MGGFGVDRLDEIMAHLGVALGVSRVKGLGIIGGCAHCWTTTEEDKESFAEKVDELPGHRAGCVCRQVQRGLGHIFRSNPVLISGGIVSPCHIRIHPVGIDAVHPDSVGLRREWAKETVYPTTPHFDVA